MVSDVEVAQKLILKVMLFQRFDFPTDALFELAGVFGVRALYSGEIGKFICQNRHVVELPEHDYKTRSVANNLARPIKHKKTHSKRFFITHVHKIYNSLERFLFASNKSITCTNLNFQVKLWLKSMTSEELLGLYCE